MAYRIIIFSLNDFLTGTDMGRSKVVVAIIYSKDIRLRMVFSVPDNVHDRAGIQFCLVKSLSYLTGSKCVFLFGSNLGIPLFPENFITAQLTSFVMTHRRSINSRLDSPLFLHIETRVPGSL